MTLFDIAKEIATRALGIDHSKPFWARCAFAAVKMGYSNGLASEGLEGIRKYLKDYDDTPKKRNIKEYTSNLMKMMRADFEGDSGVATMKKRLAPDEELFEVLARLEQPKHGGKKKIPHHAK